MGHESMCPDAANLAAGSEQRLDASDYGNRRQRASREINHT
jgi:hypothetical protein